VGAGEKRATKQDTGAGAGSRAACGKGEAGALVVGVVVGRMAAVWLCVLEGGEGVVRSWQSPSNG